MSDIVERLREQEMSNELPQCGLCDKAADEIERLRAVVDAAKVVQLVMDGDEVDCPFCAYDGLQDALAALEDDNE